MKFDNNNGCILAITLLYRTLLLQVNSFIIFACITWSFLIIHFQKDYLAILERFPYGDRRSGKCWALSLSPLPRGGWGGRPLKLATDYFLSKRCAANIRFAGTCWVDCWQLWATRRPKPNAVLHEPTKPSSVAESPSPPLQTPQSRLHWHLQLQLHTCRWQTPSWRYFWLQS